MKDKKGSLKYLFEHITIVFTLSLLGLAISGWILRSFFGEMLSQADGVIDVVIGAGGLRYEIIFQFFGLSVVIGILLLIFLSDLFLAKYMLVWRYVIFLGLASIVLSLFAVIFQWFPDIWQGVVMLLGLFILFSAISMMPTFIKIKRENRKYEEALLKYKSKQTNDNSFQ